MICKVKLKKLVRKSLIIGRGSHFNRNILKIQKDKKENAQRMLERKTVNQSGSEAYIISVNFVFVKSPFKKKSLKDKNDRKKETVKN